MIFGQVYAASINYPAPEKNLVYPYLGDMVPGVGINLGMRPRRTAYGTPVTSRPWLSRHMSNMA